VSPHPNCKRVNKTREYLGNFQGTFREHAMNIQGTFREISGNIHLQLRWRPVGLHPNCRKYPKVIRRIQLAHMGT
jgi:hypothetical protein